MSSPSPASSDRRKCVEERLRTLGRPRPARRAPPPEGRLGADEQPTDKLPAALADLGPVFSTFGRYLSSRVDLLPRRDCQSLAETGEPAWDGPTDAESYVRGQLDRAPEFVSFEPASRGCTPWTRQYDAWLPSGAPVVVTIVRPDADEWLRTDLPLLSLLAPWLDAPAADVAAAIDDFSLSIRSRLDQTGQATAFIRLVEDAQAGGALDAPRCHHDYCSRGVLTLERIDGPSLAEGVPTDGLRPSGDAFDRVAIAEQLAAAWLRQAMTGRVVPFDFDLRDVRLRDSRLVLVGGALEPLAASSRARFLAYLVAASNDDPDGAWAWITHAAAPGQGAQSSEALRRKLRQVVPFRDGEWSGDPCMAELLLAHWRAAREAGWTMPEHPLHLHRGTHAIGAATTRLASHRDTLLAAFRAERLRLDLAEAGQLFDADRLPAALEALGREAVQLPQKLDEVLTLVVSGRLRVKAEVPDDGDRRAARNHTVSLVASLVTLVALTFLVRHLSPTYGAGLEWIGALLVLIVGGWLLASASRL